MEKKRNERCCLGNFADKDCDGTTYWRNICRLDICNFDKKNTDLMHHRTLYTFRNDDNTILFYGEKVYHSRNEAVQMYCFDPYWVH